MYQHSINQKFQITRVLAALNLGRDFFIRTLENGGQGSKGLTFLLEQGISRDTIARYGLGYTTNSWDNFRKNCQVPPQHPIFDDPRVEGFFQPLRYKEFVTASLLVSKGEAEAYYDRFRGRVMFPFLDDSGQCIGFAGRKVDFSKSSEPLWTFSHNTSLFKGKEKHTIYKVHGQFFGLPQAKESIRSKGESYIVTDILDGLKLVEAGFTNTIMAPGPFTEDHVKALRKHTGKVVVLLDDKYGVGEKAALFRLDVLLGDFEVKLSLLPKGWGSDSALSQVKDILGSQRIDYVLFKAISLFERASKDPEYQEKAIRSMVRTIGFLKKASQRDHYITEVAKIGNIPEADFKLSFADFVLARESQSKGQRLR